MRTTKNIIFGQKKNTDIVKTKLFIIKLLNSQLHSVCINDFKLEYVMLNMMLFKSL